jgi:hypothetical protein
METWNLGDLLAGTGLASGYSRHKELMTCTAQHPDCIGSPTTKSHAREHKLERGLICLRTVA